MSHLGKIIYIKNNSLSIVCMYSVKLLANLSCRSVRQADVSVSRVQESTQAVKLQGRLIAAIKRVCKSESAHTVPHSQCKLIFFASLSPNTPDPAPFNKTNLTHKPLPKVAFSRYLPSSCLIDKSLTCNDKVGLHNMSLTIASPTRRYVSGGLGSNQ